MRILLTGTSSLSGAWFARSCLAAGIEVHGALRTDPEEYGDVRRRRLAMLDGATLHPGVEHGSESFVDAIRAVRPAVVGYHGFPMDGFRGFDYDVGDAIRAMTAQLDGEFAALADVGADVVYTSTVYEPGPVAGPGSRAAVSPYGVAKAAVFESLRLMGARRGVAVHRFVIPNPFGPLEEGRFGNYLAGQWATAGTPVVRTPDVIRDNIPVQELALRYAEFVLAGSARASSLSPSGYVESQGLFARRVVREVGPRLGRDLPVECLWGAPSSEPLVVTGDGTPTASLRANEGRYWDEYAAHIAELIAAAS